MSWYTQSRKTAAWIVIPAFVAMFISEAWMVVSFRRVVVLVINPSAILR